MRGVSPCIYFRDHLRSFLTKAPPPKRFLSFDKSRVIFCPFHSESLWSCEDWNEENEENEEMWEWGGVEDRDKESLVFNMCQVNKFGRCQTKDDKLSMKISDVRVRSDRRRLGSLGRIEAKQIEVKRRIVILLYQIPRRFYEKQIEVERMIVILLSWRREAGRIRERDSCIDCVHIPLPRYILEKGTHYALKAYGPIQHSQFSFIPNCAYKEIQAHRPRSQFRVVECVSSICIYTCYLCILHLGISSGLDNMVT